MASDPEKITKAPTAADMAAADVAVYLRRHPDFLDKNPEILAAMLPPARREGDGVVDLQRVMVEKLRAEIDRLRSAEHELVSLGRNNMHHQGRVHAAALALLGATTLEHLIELVGTDLAVDLDVDAATLCFEAPPPAGEARSTPDSGRAPPPDGVACRGLRLVPRGAVKRLLDGKSIVLLADEPGDKDLFGEAASLVRSQALISIEPRRGAPFGILALGSRHAEKFHPGQGTELLAFLGRVAEHCIRSWLDRTT